MIDIESLSKTKPRKKHQIDQYIRVNNGQLSVILIRHQLVPSLDKL